MASDAPFITFFVVKHGELDIRLGYQNGLTAVDIHNKSDEHVVSFTLCDMSAQLIAESLTELVIHRPDTGGEQHSDCVC